jgi:hypothetical protein
MDELHPSLYSSQEPEPAADQSLLLTAILADAFNLGLEKMAEACPGTSLAKLARRLAHPRRVLREEARPNW